MIQFDLPHVFCARFANIGPLYIGKEPLMDMSWGNTSQLLAANGHSSCRSLPTRYGQITTESRHSLRDKSSRPTEH